MLHLDRRADSYMADQMVSLPGYAASRSHFAAGSPGCSSGCQAGWGYTAAPPKPPPPGDLTDSFPPQQVPPRLQNSLPQSLCDQLLKHRRWVYEFLRSFDILSFMLCLLRSKIHSPSMFFAVEAEISERDFLQTWTMKTKTICLEMPLEKKWEKLTELT